MGCNCGGSTPRTDAPPLGHTRGRAVREARNDPPRRVLRPGQDGTTWNGPERPSPSAPEKSDQ